MKAPRPFAPGIPPAVQDDLRERLRRARWPVAPDAPPWRYGASQAYLARLIDYWAHDYDWAKTEAAINRFDNFLVELNGLDVHFILERGSGPAPRPLLLTHGWPGSIIEFLAVIEPLAHPERFGGRLEDAFTVVVPSLPGYGFSQPPAAPMSPREVGTMWRTLMVEVLGHERYFAQGGDWGSIVSSWMAYDHPEHVAALHLNLLGIVSAPPAERQTPEEKDWIARTAAWRAPEDGYRTQQATRPHTLAYALTDSPIGLAAWIVEKFHGWTVPGTQDDPPFSFDDLLGNVMLYWIGGPGPASWFYAKTAEDDLRRFPEGTRVTVPTGMLICPRDTMPPPPDSIIRRSYNLVSRTDAPTGGHFVALEQPAYFVEQVRAFFRAWPLARAAGPG